MTSDKPGKERVKLLNRVKRLRGQLDAVERTLAEDRECADVLMLLAAVRGGINGLMAEVLEDHIRLHLLQDGRVPLTPELGEELIDLVRAYLK
ncbi:metal/formaldehyde-sensitive transcriptional repressor [Granulicella aggregans]|jgi:DNA-binding FrmR family transcriptional regulator|uniref:metal/formaldehyde-sensitive transcriptional repressor n=1 Tax=Granulicella aggregans TaxID=474949 RepID=UPI0021DFFAC5|nr:metal/formaldehyde-sensitive transcriptional repressor [Granulicella aggregans]